MNQNLAQIISDQKTNKDYEFLYELYILWKSYPTMLRGAEPALLKKFGLEEDLMLELLSIPDQQTFAEHFEINENTPTYWNKKMDKEGRRPDPLAWAKKLTPNVIASLYKNITNKGSAAEFGMWMEYIEGKPRKQTIILKNDLAEILDELEVYATDGETAKSDNQGQHQPA